MGFYSYNGGYVGSGSVNSKAGVFDIKKAFDAGDFLPPGQLEFTTPGSQSWIVPFGINAISVVAVGGGGGGSASTTHTNGFSGGGGSGGGLAWSNNILVSAGETLTIEVGAAGLGGTYDVNTSTGNDDATSGGNSGILRGTTVLVRGIGGTRGTYNSSATASGGGYTGDGGGVGGTGGGGQSGHESGGGGGAGGYSGPGGNGGTGNSGSIPTAGTGGGGGGDKGVNNFVTKVFAGGGGVGIYGEGASGAAPTTATAGGDRTGGALENGGSPGSGGTYKNFGGGGSGAEDDSPADAAEGGPGVVRIIWGDQYVTRAFPNTNTGDY